MELERRSMRRFLTFHGKRRPVTGRLLAATAFVAAAVAVARPAVAQVYWGDNDRNYGDRYRNWNNYNNNYQQRDFFFPFSGFNRPAPVVDSTKAPPPRKLETPATTNIVVVGDSMADWLGYGLDELYTDQPEMGVERKIRAASGLIRYDAKNEALDWPQAVKDALAGGKPDAIVVMLGLNDRTSLRDKTPPPPTATKRAGEPPQEKSQEKSQEKNQAKNQDKNQEKSQGAAQGTSQPPPQDKAAEPTDTEAPPQSAAQADTQHPAAGSSYEFHTDEWATVYGKRIDEMIAALKSKGVPIVWVGLPAIRGAKSTGDITYLDDLYREHAEKAGIVYVDIWDGFVDDQGRYAVQGPDFEGQTRRLRTSDGVHFTKAGAVKLASYVDRDLRRVMSNHVTPVAVPGPETAPKPATGGGRPEVGPVLPLATGGGESGDLAGAGHPTQMTADPIATKVLSHGDAVIAPAGRADDFSWPRPGNDANATPEVSPQPVALAPSAPVKKGEDAKKPADAKATNASKDTPAGKDTNAGKDANAAKDTKNKPARDPAVARTRRSPNADLDGAPIPPAPVGSR